MKTALHLVLLGAVCVTSAHRRASVTVTANHSQYFEYGTISVSCEQFSPGEWRVWRYTSGGLKLSQCGNGWGSLMSSSCIISSAKLSDSGVYWCGSKHRESSNTVNITVTGGPVILQSPVLPVMEGDDVTLQCKTKTSNLPAGFYKDGSLIRTEPAGHMTIHHVSKSDEGLYKCNISSHGESDSSWISVKGNSAPVTLTVSPDSSQHFEYRSLDLSCGENSSFTGWKVRRFIDNKKITSCGDEWGSPASFGCQIQTAKRPDTGTYWCETDAKQLSNSVSITVHDGPVILQSPVLPVMEGDDVTLHCKTKTSNLPAGFYKDGSLIRTEPAGHMTIHHVSKSDEGLYKCNTSSHGESPPSWLFVRDLPPAETEPLRARESLLRIIRHVVKFGTFFIATVLMVLSFLHKPRAPSAKRPADQQQAVSVTTPPSVPTREDDVTTEHHF